MNKEGITLQKIINNQGYHIYMPNLPTFIPNIRNHQPDYLDYMITNFNLTTMGITYQELDSDHLPVIYYMDDKSIDKNKKLSQNGLGLISQYPNKIPLF